MDVLSYFGDYRMRNVKKLTCEVTLITGIICFTLPYAVNVQYFVESDPDVLFCK